MITVYGIKNCDTIKKAVKWLKANDIEFIFHDFKKDSLESKTLDKWLTAVDWEVLLNKRGTTWRKLPDDIKNNINITSAKDVMLKNLSIIKRPVLTVEDDVYIGFNEKTYQEIFLIK